MYKRHKLNPYWNDPAFKSCQTMDWSGLARTLSQKNGFNFAFWPSDSLVSLVSSPTEERPRLCGPRSEVLPELPGFGGLGGGGRPTFGGGGALGAGALGAGGGGGFGGGGADFPGGAVDNPCGGAVLPGGSGNGAWLSPDAPFIASDSCPSASEVPDLMGKLLTLDEELKSFLLEFAKSWEVCEEPER